MIRPVVASPKRPYWPEPTRPEHQPAQNHLQVRDRYVEELLAFRLDSVAANGWGLAELALDQQALAARVFRVNRLVGRFRSGAPAHVDARRPLTLPLPTPKLGASAITVHLALARHAVEGPSVVEGSVDGRAVRFRRSATEAGDTVLEPYLQLRTEEENADGFERLPLARLLLQGNAITIDPDFLPPLLNLLEGTFLPGALDGVRQALLVRQAELFAAREARPFSIHDFSAAEAPAFLLLSSISQALAALGASPLAPRRLYATLSELLGALDAIEGTPLLERAIAPYDQRAAGAAFRSVIDRLHRLVPRVAKPAHRAFRLQRLDGATFGASLDDADTLGSAVYLVASGGAVSEAILLQLPAQAKIASPTRLRSILPSAVSGVPLGAEFDPPRSLPSSRTHFCFRLNTRSEYWSEIVAARSIAVHVPSASPQLEMVLYAVDERRR